jgi:hypothetical protein
MKTILFVAVITLASCTGNTEATVETVDTKKVDSLSIDTVKVAPAQSMGDSVNILNISK